MSSLHVDDNPVVQDVPATPNVEPGTRSRSPSIHSDRENSDDDREQESLKNAVHEYQETAKILEEKLKEFFVKHEKRTGIKIWEPSPPLNATGDALNLQNVMADLRAALEKLVPPFEQKKSRNWIDKLIGWTLPPLKNFLLVGIEGQSVGNRKRPIKLMVSRFLSSIRMDFFAAVSFFSFQYVSHIISVLIPPKVSEADSERRDGFAKELWEMYEQLNNMKDVFGLPEQFFSTSKIQCRAFAILTNMLNLAMTQVRYLTNPLRKPGKYCQVSFFHTNVVFRSNYYVTCGNENEEI
jgi:hypothetical protein